MPQLSCFARVITNIRRAGKGTTGWSLKLTILWAIYGETWERPGPRPYEEWSPPQRWIVDAAGLTYTGLVSRAFSELVASNVLERRIGGGPGMTGHRYRLNRDVTQWTGVPWRDPTLITVAHPNLLVNVARSRGVRNARRRGLSFLSKNYFFFME